LKKITAALLAALMFISCLTVSAAAQTYTDVSSGSWYYDAVSYVTGKGLFNGTSATAFSPQSTMTRGMFVTVLGRYANVKIPGGGTGTITKTSVNMRSEPNTGSAVVAVLDIDTTVTILSFADGWYRVSCGSNKGYVRGDLMTENETGAYYGPYVQWACSSGVETGATASNFMPDKDITREEICAMLYNYAKNARLDITPVTTQSVFADDSLINPSYKTAVCAMQQLGVVKGRGANEFAPGANATRAEVAVMLNRFIENAGYNYSMPVPEGTAVNTGYFDDACFIGHSLIVGMETYSGLSNPDYYAVNGISAQRMLTYDGFELDSTHTNESGDTMPDTGTLSDVLNESSYGKIYIMLGTNELGPEPSHLASYYSSMCSIVDTVKKTQPGAKIYLISIPPVSVSTSEESAYFNLENILSFNGKLAQVALEKQVYYLNIFSLLADDEGYLPDNSCMSDGIHFLSEQYYCILGYLKTHAVG
jgi:hypothetical protein